MKYKPQLAPNKQPDLNDIEYPILASYKLDGIRCIFYKGEMLSRSLKPIVNKQLREKFQPIADYSKEHNLILDGEIYSHELTFQEIVKYVMTQDFEDKKSIKKNGKVLTIPEHLKFYCFDVVRDDNFDKRFIERNGIVDRVACCFENLIETVKQIKVNSRTDVESLFNIALIDGYEGLILKDPSGRYKCGRGTIRDALIFKVKPFRTTDALIKGIVQSTEVNEDAEKKTNELNRSVTSKRKNDRHFIEKASAFLVDYHGQDLKVTLSMTDVEKIHVWNNQKDYIGKWVEYKFMTVGMKEDGLPRHPTTIRMRMDKN